MRRTASFIAFLLLLQLCAEAQSTLLNEPHRPQYHFSPRVNWINDPNGLLYHQGEYHLFYQYNPFGQRWGHMTWGHAVSRDLVQWEELPPAIPEENGIMIFSGSAVMDFTNSTGFGKNGQVPMVAIYTGHQQNRQSQHLAYSLDNGRTWTKYDKNPVLDLEKKDFRDPNVFWHAASGQWVMSVVIPEEQKVLFYNSKNLTAWNKTGEFQVLNDKLGIWECPSLLEVPVEGTPGKKWVLLQSIGNGSVAGGSGMLYFVGEFDGKSFKPQDRQLRYVDYGKDYYAAIHYNHLSSPVTVGWMNNWQYANDLPVSPWKGAMSLPRELSLAKKGNTYELRQQPVAELQKLRQPPLVLEGMTAASLSRALSGLNTTTLELKIEAEPKDFVVKLRKGDGEETLLGYDAAKRELYLDRTRSGHVQFHKDFPARFAAPLPAADGKIKLHVFLDRSSVEVFANDGAATITAQIFPRPESTDIEIAGTAVRKVEAWPLESTYR
ncbi:glycoside hydrolase family 32 protein [Telluribacter sp.]|jgi:fructan beta-fructosidase|uniref:glycoside hydrolase family 32 protein n=1 Tax=Telluribacter sp. TaxID=1978767 RepID=UPI002E0DA21F|nr:glycoside hydrolase family 32 protein [Telluribacter sp.]